MKKAIFPFLATLLFSNAALADDAKLKQQLERIGATNVSLSESVLPHFKTAVSDQGVIHISQDGRFVVQGQIYEIQGDKVIDLTNQALLAELDALKGQMIVYPAKNEKHIVTVFMDISCHYCHLLHAKIKQYNDLGITIRYLAFPRSGINSQTARQMEAIWTAKDKVFALNEAEKGKLPTTLKSPNIVKTHYALGVKFGITGTPSIVTSTGTLIPGFVEPKALLEMLNP